MRHISVLLPISYSWISFCQAQKTYVATLQFPDNLFNGDVSSQNFTGVATTTDGTTQYTLQCGGFATSFCNANSNGVNPSLYFNASPSTTHYDLSTSGYEDCGPTTSEGGTASCTFTPSDLIGGNMWISEYSTDGTTGTTRLSYFTDTYTSVYPVIFTYLENELAAAIGATELNTRSSSSSLSSSPGVPTISPTAAGSPTPPTPTPTSSSTPSGSHSGPDPAGLSSSQKIGTGLGVALGVLALAFVGFLVYRRRKSKSKSRNSGAHLYFSTEDKGHNVGMNP